MAADQCRVNFFQAQSEVYSWVQQFMHSTPLIDCHNLTRPISKESARQLLDAMTQRQKLALGHDQLDVSRHTIGERLNHCEPRSGEKGLVINFEGTGSFSPRTGHLLKEFSDCTGGDGDLGQYLYYETQKAIKRTYGTSEAWSALQNGPLRELALAGATKDLGWVTFASEESEVLADPKNLSSYSAVNSAIAPRGIVSAAKCINKYLSKAKERGIKPKIIVQGHSSGSRSAVKFIEYLNHLEVPIKVDLMLTIDPVKEAHLAVNEVMGQYAGNANRSIYNTIPFVDDLPIVPPNVWTRRQPATLYRPTNVQRAVSVYQNIDTEGIKGPVKFGIRGSPIHDADLNLYLKEGLGSDAHGAISKHERTLKLVRDEYKKLGLLP